MGELFHPEDRIPPSRAIANDDLPRELASAYLRISDIPLAFQRESPGLSAVPTTFGTVRPHVEMGSRLEKFGRMLQYRFTDGTILSGHQVLYHPYSKDVPRHLLPLNVNVKSDLQDRTAPLIDGGTGNTGSQFRSQWQVQAEKVLLSILLGRCSRAPSKTNGR